MKANIYRSKPANGAPFIYIFGDLLQLEHNVNLRVDLLNDSYLDLTYFNCGWGLFDKQFKFIMSSCNSALIHPANDPDPYLFSGSLCDFNVTYKNKDMFNYTVAQMFASGIASAEQEIERVSEMRDLLHKKLEEALTEINELKKANHAYEAAIPRLKSEYQENESTLNSEYMQLYKQSQQDAQDLEKSLQGNKEFEQKIIQLMNENQKLSDTVKAQALTISDQCTIINRATKGQAKLAEGL